MTKDLAAIPADIARHRGTLAGRVALVTGASRGAGRAIAKVLGEAGATVIVTGRSTRATGTTEGLPGTIEDTAEIVTRAGGRGVPVRIDHTDEAAIAALADRMRNEFGRLDLLVNNAWGGYESYPGTEAFLRPLWQQPLDTWDRMFTAGVRAHVATNRFLLPLLIGSATPQRPTLVLSTVAWAYGAYLGNLLYDVSKAALVRMAAGLAEELRPYNVASLAVAPGWIRTERLEAVVGDAPFDFSPTESPEYVGRAIAALATDPGMMARSGQVVTAGDLAREFGFTDVDGRQPEGFRLPGAV